MTKYNGIVTEREREREKEGERGEGERERERERERKFYLTSLSLAKNIDEQMRVDH